MHLSPKERIAYACVVGLVLAGLAFVGAQHLRQPAKIVFSGLDSAAKPKDQAARDTTQADEVVVDVAGAVKHPGVVHLKPGSRVDDAVAAAGGALPDADLSKTNLAAKLIDGTQVQIHHAEDSKDDFKPVGPISPIVIREPKTVAARPASKGQPKPGKTSAAPPKAKPDETPADFDVYASDVARSSGSVAPSSSSSTSQPSGNSRTKKSEDVQVSINDAAEGEFTKVPGIGPATAAKIVEYRQANGAFKSIDDLRNVRGIGAKKLDSIRKYLRL